VEKNADKLDKIISLLDELVAISKNPSSISTQNAPWPSRLLQELANGEDMDGNGLVYGHDFIFNQMVDWHPPALKAAAETLKQNWKGKTMTFVEYVETLDPANPKIDKIFDFIEKRQQLNG